MNNTETDTDKIREKIKKAMSDAYTEYIRAYPIGDPDAPPKYPRNKYPDVCSYMATKGLEALSLLKPCSECGGSGIVKQQEDGGVAELFCDCPIGEAKLETFLKENPDCRPACQPAGEIDEFVETVRHKLLDVALYCGGLPEMTQVFQDLKQACDHLTALLKRCEQLEEEIKGWKTNQDVLVAVKGK